MNLRQGRIGKQEAAALALTACTVGGVFMTDAQSAYASGNSTYASSILSALAALLLFDLVAEAMRKKRCKNLAQLYRFAFGRILSIPVMIVSVCVLLYAAVMPLVQLLLIMNHFVYVFEKVAHIALYLLPCLLLLAWMGLEILGRTAKLFFGLLLLSFLATFVIAIPSYEAFRLYPLLGTGLPELLRRSAMGTARFFPALLCLLICGVGVQGVQNAALGGAVGAVGGGVITSVTQFLLGMAYPNYMLAEMRVPLYRLTMAVSGARVYLRADKILLFFWMLAGMIAGGFFAYAAALLYAGVTRMRDIRPAVAALAVTTCAVTLMGQMNFAPFLAMINAVKDFAWIAALLPPLAASMLALLKKEAAV